MITTYTNVKPSKIIRENGMAMEVVKGVITPETTEEVKLCEYFAKIGVLKKHVISSAPAPAPVNDMKK